MKMFSGNSRVLFLTLIAAVVVSSIFFVVLLNADSDDNENTATTTAATNTNATTSSETESVTWETYTNTRFGFSIEYPSDWEVRAFLDDQIAPTINFYPTGTDTAGLPFTHHSEGVTHVSIFPHGIPTEGFFGPSVDSEATFAAPVMSPRDFVLADDTRFATIVPIDSPNDNWTESGFLFAHNVVHNRSTSCRRGDTEISIEACDPLMGDTIVRSGTINTDDRATIVRMLESFQFIE